MAAGSLNTTRLLVRAAAKGKIPDMPDGLGGNWGTNADRIYTWTCLDTAFGAPQGGPVVYGVSDARGRFEYRAAIDDAVLHWPKDGASAIQNSTIGPLVHRIAGPAS